MTRWIVVGLLIVMAFVTVFRRSTPWVGEDLNAALSNSAKDKMPVVAVVGAEWCTFCHKFQDQTLPDKEVKAALKDWRLTLVDGDSLEGKKTVERYQVGGLPTILFLDSSGTEIERVVGFLPPSDFVKAIEQARAQL
jgi:thioredoxin:protein disulfide reductase